MRILVLGGTGSIGCRVVLHLLGQGHEVLGLARSQTASDRLRGWGAHPLHGDIAEPDRWVGAVDHCDGVIHAAATFDADMGRIDAILVRALIGRMARQPHTPALIYTGGCWLYGRTGDRIATETFPFMPLPAVSWMVEHQRMVREAPGIRGMVLHPAMVWHRDGGGILAPFIEDLRRFGRPRVIGHESIRWPLVEGDDLAALYLLMLEHGKAGEVYNGASLDGMPVGSLARGIATRLGYGDPAPLVRPVEDAVAERGEWAEGFALDQRMSGGKARRDLGWSPRYPNPLDSLGDAP